MEEELICKECMNVFEKPILMNCCGYTICEPCLKAQFEDQKETNCNRCGKLIHEDEVSSFTENIFITRILENYNTQLQEDQMNSSIDHQIFNMTVESHRTSPQQNSSRRYSIRDSIITDRSNNFKPVNLLQTFDFEEELSLRNNQDQNQRLQTMMTKQDSISNRVNYGRGTSNQDFYEKKINAQQKLIDQGTIEQTQTEQSNSQKVSSDDAIKLMRNQLKLSRREMKKQASYLSRKTYKLQCQEVKLEQQVQDRTRLVESIFSLLRQKSVEAEYHLLEELKQQQKRVKEDISEKQSDIKDHFVSCHNMLKFIEQSFENLQFTLDGGHIFLADKMTQNKLSWDKVYRAKVQSLEIDQVIQDKLKDIFQEINELLNEQHISLSNNEIKDDLANEVPMRSSRRFNQDDFKNDDPNDNQKSNSNALVYKERESNGKKFKTEQKVPHHKRLSSAQDLTLSCSDSQENSIHQNHGESQQSFQKSESIQEDSQEQLNEGEMRFTFGKKKDLNILMASQVQNLNQKITQSSLNENFESGIMSKKNKVQKIRALNTSKKNNQNKEQIIEVISNTKTKTSKHKRHIQSNVENFTNKLGEEQSHKKGNTNQNIQAMLQSSTNLESQISPQRPIAGQYQNQQLKHKTPAILSQIIEHQRKPNTPKNFTEVQKRDFNFTQSKSAIKHYKQQSISLYNDSSISRIPQIRDDSAEMMGKTSFSLRRHSRNNLSSTSLLKQSIQSKISSMLSNQGTLQQSTSTSNLRQLIIKPQELSKAEIKDLTEKPLQKRRFIVKACYSSSVQVSWSHPKGTIVQGLRYVLEYGVGIKVSGNEQFRQIYKGKAFKCIVTDLMPKTNYRFRVKAILQQDGKEDDGEWSDIESLQTTDFQQIDLNSLTNIAVLSNQIQRVQNTVNTSTQLSPFTSFSQSALSHLQNERWIQFERPGLIHALNPLTFGKHYWSVHVQYFQNLNLNNEEFSGLIKLGVFSKSSTSQKIHGPVVNYSTSKGIIKLKFFLDVDRKHLKVYTSSNLKGEMYTDLPDSQIYAAAQNMTMRSMNANLKVLFAFDLQPFEINAGTGCIKEL